MKKWIWVIGLVVIVLGLAVVVSNKRQATSSESHVINYAQIKVFDPVYVGMEKGFFEKEGVKVNLVGESFGGPQAITAAASGDVDAGIAATTAIINARAAGIPIKGILDVQSTYQGTPLMIWYTLADSSIKKPSDLVGKKIGINTLGASFHYTTLEYLRQNGIDPSKVEFITMPHANLEQALRTHQIDVAGMIDPYSIAAEKGGGLTRLFTDYDVLGNKQFSLIFMREQKINDDRESVTRFVRAYQQSIDYINNHPNESADIMARVFGVDSQFVAAHTFQKDGRVVPDDGQYWLDFMKNQQVEGITGVAVQDIIDPSFTQ